MAIFGWACRIPSKIHSSPNPIRSHCRQEGSAAAVAGVPSAAAPLAAWAAGSQARTVIQANPSSAKISSAMIPWCTSAVLNAATTVGSLTLIPEFIPDISLPAPLI